MPKTVIISGDGITLDLLLWRAFGREGYALLEETLAQNSHLAQFGPVLPSGVTVVLPDFSQQPKPIQKISLFV